MNGKPYGCSTDRSKCALHLHSYTSRRDVRDQFSATAAVGMMMGVGSIGSSLQPYVQSDTFLTRDAGRTWIEVTKDAHTWEFGDHGGILLLMNDEVPTDSVKYSLDMGKTFLDLRINEGLAGAKLGITYMFTEPTGTSSKFVIFGRVNGGPANGENVAITLDFDKVFGRNCDFVEGDPVKSDFEVWSPSGADIGAGNETCFFGQQVRSGFFLCFQFGLLLTCILSYRSNISAANPIANVVSVGPSLNPVQRSKPANAPKKTLNASTTMFGTHKGNASCYQVCNLRPRIVMRMASYENLLRIEK